MKKQDALDAIETGIEETDGYSHSDTASKILENLLKAGMVPVSSRSGLFGKVSINKFEEDISEREWDFAFEMRDRE